MILGQTLDGFSIGFSRSAKLATVKAMMAASPLFLHNATEADKLKARTVVGNLEARAKAFEASALTPSSEPTAVAYELDRWDDDYDVLAAWVQSVQNRQVTQAGQAVAGAAKTALFSLGAGMMTIIGLGIVGLIVFLKVKK